MRRINSIAMFRGQLFSVMRYSYYEVLYSLVCRTMLIFLCVSITQMAQVIDHEDRMESWARAKSALCTYKRERCLNAIIPTTCASYQLKYNFYSIRILCDAQQYLYNAVLFGAQDVARFDSRVGCIDGTYVCVINRALALLGQ